MLIVSFIWLYFFHVADPDLNIQILMLQLAVVGASTADLVRSGRCIPQHHSVVASERTVFRFLMLLVAWASSRDVAG